MNAKKLEHGGRGATHHSAECNRLFDKYKAALKAYEAKWPKHCHDCGGAGSFYSPGNREQPPDVDICSKCVEIGMCPRCGANSLKTGEEERCSACDFDLSKPQEVKPEYECICF